MWPAVCTEVLCASYWTSLARISRSPCRRTTLPSSVMLPSTPTVARSLETSTLPSARKGPPPGAPPPRGGPGGLPSPGRWQHAAKRDDDHDPEWARTRHEERHYNGAPRPSAPENP